MHEVWSVRSWYVSPFRQPEHTRSDEAVGAAVWYDPGEQTADQAWHTTSSEIIPPLGWNRPASHKAHCRSDDAVPCTAITVPFGHWAHGLHENPLLRSVNVGE